VRHLHFDIVSGIAGDMTLAALLHLGAPLDPIREAIDAMELGRIDLTASHVKPQGISAMTFSVDDDDQVRHRSWKDVKDLLAKPKLSARVYQRAFDIFSRLAAAEAKIHGVDLEQVHFHEVGAIDSIVDIVGSAIAVQHFEPEIITSSTPLLGRGVIQCQHGVIPVPAPATLELLTGIPTRGLDIEAELTTPTGAAILASVVDEYTSWPEMRVEKIGYGAGSRQIEGRPNILRVIVGESKASGVEDEMLVEANIDDMNPQHFDFLMNRLLEAGAHDVWLQPIVMKKSRPAITLSVLCNSDKLDLLERIIFTESTTIGLRRSPVARRKLSRRLETIETKYGSIQMKLSGDEGEIWTVSPEYRDCVERARQHKVPIKEVCQAAIDAWHKQSS
jgi:uncharacterized protein (TIGR00299 family) protein